MNHLIALLLLLAVPALAFPSLERIQQIENMAESLTQEQLVSGVRLVQDSAYQGLAVSHKVPDGYTITVNPVEFAKLSKSAQDLVGFHELGHIRLGHCDMDPTLKVRSEVELEADFFAAFLYRRFDQVNTDIENFVNQISSSIKTVPPGGIRAEVFRSVLFPQNPHSPIGEAHSFLF